MTGLLRLATSVLKHKPAFKFSREGQEFLRDVHDVLFLLPSLTDRLQPKCKSHAARAAAYDLLTEMLKGSVENYRLLHNWVMAQHMQGNTHLLSCYPTQVPWDVPPASSFTLLPQYGLSPCYSSKVFCSYPNKVPCSSTPVSFYSLLLQ